MYTRFYEDAVSLTELKAHPERVIKRTTEAGRPVPLTRRGRRVAVIQSFAAYESAAEERAFMCAVVAALADLEGDREVSWCAARARLRLEGV